MKPMTRIEKYIDKLALPKGKTIVITGGNSGIGFASALHLARQGWNLILAVRNLVKGEEAKKQILAQFPKANVKVEFLELSSFKSVQNFIEKVISENWDIDAFYCNAGVYRVPYSLTEDGFETTCAVNFLANLKLYLGLKDYLQTLPHPVKWILTSSIVARNSHFNEEDFLSPRKYHPYGAYKKSKVAVNKLFLYLKQDCEGTNILPLLVHPGITYTPLIAKGYQGKRFQIAAQRFMRLAFHKPEKAALCTLKVLDEGITTPCFCGPRGPLHLSGYPKIYRLHKGNLKDFQQTLNQAKELLHEGI